MQGFGDGSSGRDCEAGRDRIAWGSVGPAVSLHGLSTAGKELQQLLVTLLKLCCEKIHSVCGGRGGDKGGRKRPEKGYFCRW